MCGYSRHIVFRFVFARHICGRKKIGLRVFIQCDHNSGVHGLCVAFSSAVLVSRRNGRMRNVPIAQARTVAVFPTARRTVRLSLRCESLAKRHEPPFFFARPLCMAVFSVSPGTFGSGLMQVCIFVTNTPAVPTYSRNANLSKGMAPPGDPREWVRPIHDDSRTLAAPETPASTF